MSFTSTSIDLTTADDGNLAVADVYARDIGSKITARASAASDGTTQSLTAPRALGDRAARGAWWPS